MNAALRYKVFTGDNLNLFGHEVYARDAVAQYDNLPLASTHQENLVASYVGAAGDFRWTLPRQMVLCFVYDAGPDRAGGFTAANQSFVINGNVTGGSPHISPQVSPPDRLTFLTGTITFQSYFRFMTSADGVTFTEPGPIFGATTYKNKAFNSFNPSDSNPSSPYYLTPYKHTGTTAIANTGNINPRFYVFLYLVGIQVPNANSSYETHVTLTESIQASVQLTVPCPQLPAPATIQARPDNVTRLTHIYWDAVAGATGYVVRRDGVMVARTERLCWQDSFTSASGTGGREMPTPAHVYSVCAINGCGEGAVAFASGVEAVAV